MNWKPLAPLALAIAVIATVTAAASLAGPLREVSPRPPAPLAAMKLL